MEELAGAGAQTADGILSSASFDDLKSQTRDQIIRDPGMGPMPVRGPLLSQIPRNSMEFTPASFKYKTWVSAIPNAKDEYIQNWRVEFQNQGYSDTPGSISDLASPAESASFLASHLLYLGLTSSYVSRWLNYRVQHDPLSYNLDKILEEMADLIRKGRGRMEVLVILARPPQEKVRSTQGWLDVRSVRNWLANNRLAAPRTIHGGILFDSDQWELDGALLNVAKAVHRLRQRAIIKTGRAPTFYGTAWIAGVNNPRHLPLTSQAGKAMTRGYELSDPQVEAPTSDNRLEVAVDLLSAALSESGPSAAGTLWATLEALLAAPGDPDRIQVANRAADVALVALVQASIHISLGTLFSRCPEDALMLRLRGLDKADRLVQFEYALRRDEHDGLSHRNTRLALSHTRRLFEPEVLQMRREELRQTLRGLYRQRNLVLHGGITDAPLLEGILRSSTPLVAAVVNLYARASQDNTVDPHIFAYEMYVRIERYLADPRDIVGSL